MSKSMGSSVLGKTRLKKAGGSLMTTIPAAARNMLHLRDGQEMAVSVEGAKVIFEPVTTEAKPVRRSKYSLEELVAQCNPEQAVSDEERTWQNTPAAGREIW